MSRGTVNQLKTPIYDFANVV